MVTSVTQVSLKLILYSRFVISGVTRPTTKSLQAAREAAAGVGEGAEKIPNTNGERFNLKYDTTEMRKRVKESAA